MRYNTQFKMSDLFLNKKLKQIVPQFDKHDVERGELSDYKIFTRSQSILNGFLNGSIEGDIIEVHNKSITSVMSTVNACKAILEALFDNSSSLIDNLRQDKKLYVSFCSTSQINGLTDNHQKIKVLQEILDNLNYNPNFGCPNCVRSYSPLPYQKRQELWKRKVNYKE